MSDEGAGADGWTGDTNGPVSRALRDGLARGRARFNRGDFWGSHEALEEAWLIAPEPERAFFQGLIQAAAACHKLVVQDNPGGALRLIARSLANLEAYPCESHGVDLSGFRSQLDGWRGRVLEGRFEVGPVPGLPRIDWAPGMAGRLLQVEEVRLHAVDCGTSRAVLVAVSARGATGWGECRHRWGAHGLWDSLAHGVAPALLSEAVATPGELAVVWPGLVESRAALAGVEAAFWDLWSRLDGCSLHEALGFEARDISLAVALSAGDTSALGARMAAACRSRYAMIVLPARPNADRRVIPALVSVCSLPVALDLGRAYRLADVDVLRVLDATGPRMLADPVPPGGLAAARRLRRWLQSPIGLSGWESADSVTSALDLGGMDAVILDPGLCGLAEARAIADVAHEAGAPLWIVSSAATPVGAAADLGLAMHRGASVPAALSSALAPDGTPAVAPNHSGYARPAAGLGIGPGPDEDWLEAVTVRHLVLRG